MKTIEKSREKESSEMRQKKQIFFESKIFELFVAIHKNRERKKNLRCRFQNASKSQFELLFHIISTCYTIADR